LAAGLRGAGLFFFWTVPHVLNEMASPMVTSPVAVAGDLSGERPLVQLTVGLLETYKRINRVYYEVGPSSRVRVSPANPCRAR
jgi:hypothetical protein